MCKINIAYSFDENYAQHAYCSLLSLIVTSKQDVDYDFSVVADNLKEGTIKLITNLVEQHGHVVNFISLDDVVPDKTIGSLFSRNSYARLFLSEYLQDKDRVLYVDSDTIFLRGLDEVFNINMEGRLVAGVQDTVNRYYKLNIGLGDDDLYINVGGIILLNLKLWREMKIVDKCRNFINLHHGNPPHNDQGTINHVCKGYIKLLPPEYNVMNPMFMFSAGQIKRLFGMSSYYSDAELKRAKHSPIVVHYTQEFFNRPWFANCTHPLKHKYLDVLKNTPWYNGGSLPRKPLSRNCRIQNIVLQWCPFFVYKMMLKAVELRHRLFS